MLFVVLAPSCRAGERAAGGAIVDESHAAGDATQRQGARLKKPFSVQLSG